MKKAVALVATLVLCGSAAAAISSSSPLPRAVERTIAREMPAGTAYVPSSVPSGYELIYATTTPPRGRALAGDLTIHFARRGKRLLWSVSWPTQSHDCLHSPRSRFARTLAAAQKSGRAWRGRVHGTVVTLLPGRHVRSAFTCIRSRSRRFEVSAWGALTAGRLVGLIARARLARLA